MINGKNVFNQPIKVDLRTYDNIRKTAIGQGNDYTIGRLLDYPYFKEHCQLIAKDLSKQQAFGNDPKAIRKLISLKI